MEKSLLDDEAPARMDLVGFLLFYCHHSSQIGGKFENLDSTSILKGEKRVRDELK